MVSATASSRPALRRLSRLALGLAVGATLLSAATLARADGPPRPAVDKATAEALFDHARTLMKEGKYAEACPKLAESQRLDAGLGTMLYLADCYEKTGQTASAWTEFLDAAAVAHATGQPEREQKARERGAALEPRLNRLSISLASGADVPGLQVRADGRPLDRALWGKPVPIDPGEHSVSATAPGKQPWSKNVQISASDTATAFAVVPPLVEEARPEEPSKGAPPVTVGVTPRPPGDTDHAGTDAQGSPRRSSSPPSLPPSSPPPPDTHVGVRRLGYTMIGLGLAGAAAGGVIGAVALLKSSDSTATCRIDNVCLGPAAAARSSAYSLANVSTIVLGSGAGVFAVGVVIAIVARAPEPSTASLQVRPLVGAGLGGLEVGGAF